MLNDFFTFLSTNPEILDFIIFLLFGGGYAGNEWRKARKMREVSGPAEQRAKTETREIIMRLDAKTEDIHENIVRLRESQARHEIETRRIGESLAEQTRRINALGETVAEHEARLAIAESNQDALFLKANQFGEGIAVLKHTAAAADHESKTKQA